MSLATLVALGGVGGFQAIGDGSTTVIVEKAESGESTWNASGSSNTAGPNITLGGASLAGESALDGDSYEADLGPIAPDDYSVDSSGSAAEAQVSEESGQSSWDLIKGGFGDVVGGLGSIADGILPGDGLHPLAIADGVLPGDGFVGEDGFFSWAGETVDTFAGTGVLGFVPGVNGFLDAILPGSGVKFTDIWSTEDGIVHHLGQGIQALPNAANHVAGAVSVMGPFAPLAAIPAVNSFMDSIVPGTGLSLTDIWSTEDGILHHGAQAVDWTVRTGQDLIAAAPNAANHAAGAVITMGPFAPLAAIPMVNGLVDRIMPGSGLTFTDVMSTEDGVLHHAGNAAVATGQGIVTAGEWTRDRAVEFGEAQVERVRRDVEMLQHGAEVVRENVGNFVEDTKENIGNAGEAVYEFSDASDTDGNINRALSDAVGTQMSSELSELGNHYRGGNEDAIRAAAKDWAADLSSAQIQDAIDALEDVQNGSGYETTQDFAGFVIDELSKLALES